MTHPSPRPADVADDAHRADLARARDLTAVPWVGRTSGAGWTAARSDADSNDLNVVLSEPGARASSQELAAVRRWFGDRPATWLAATPDPALTEVLEGAGWRAESTGRVCGRSMWTPDESARVRRVEDAGGLESWLDVATACGWFDGTGERRVRRRLASSLPWARWVAVEDGEAVGMATAWRGADLLEIVDVAVVDGARRRGLGTELVAATVAWSAGAERVVAAPSPDGSRLFGSLGFQEVAALPHTACYLAP